MRVRFNSIEGDKIRTIERFQPFGAMFVQLHDHLEEVGMHTEEFGISPFIDKDKRAGLDIYFCSATEHRADGHGIFFEISVIDEEGNRIPFVTGSTPGNKPGDYLRMARIAAECCIMLNGFDNLIAIPEDIRRYLDSKRHGGSGERVVETRKLGADNLRELCCEREWCNAVDNERYNDLMTFADKDNITAADILYIAERIDEFTSGSDYNGHVDSICFDVAKKCWSTFQMKEV